MQTFNGRLENDPSIEVSALLTLVNRARLKSREDEQRIIKEAIRQATKA
jgi:hypothetical protein